MKIEIESRAGREYNEDLVFQDTNTIVLMDGATSLVKNEKLKYETSGQWLVRAVKTLLKSNVYSLDPREFIDELTVDINAKYKIYNQTESNPDLDASSSFIKVDIGTEYLNYIVIGDSTLCIKYYNGKIEKIYDDSLSKIDNEAIEEMKRISTEKSISISDARSEIKTKLIENRAKKNKEEGYSVLTTNGVTPPKILSSINKIKVDEVESIYMYSDGVSTAYDTLEMFKSEHDLIEKVDNDGIAALLDSIRETENKDSELIKYPRFKKSDDATFVYAILGESYELKTKLKAIANKYLDETKEFVSYDSKSNEKRKPSINTRGFEDDINKLMKTIVHRDEIEKIVSSYVDSEDVYSHEYFICMFTYVTHLRKFKNYKDAKKIINQNKQFINTNYNLAFLFLQTMITNGLEATKLNTIIDAEKTTKVEPVHIGYLHNYAETVIFYYEQNPDKVGSDESNNHLRSALEAIETVIDEEDKYAKFKSTKGRILTVLKRYDDAIKEFDSAINDEDESAADFQLKIVTYTAYKLDCKLQQKDSIREENSNKQAEETKSQIKEASAKREQHEEQMKNEIEHTKRESFEQLTLFVAVISIIMLNVGVLDSENILGSLLIMVSIVLSFIILFSWSRLLNSTDDEIQKKAKSSIKIVAIILIAAIIFIIGFILFSKILT